jgi:hypothetical protein
MSVTGRRSDIVTLLRAACAPIDVCDDEPAVIAGDAAIVVTWDSSTRDTVQWLHRFEVAIVVTHADPAAFYKLRDTLLGVVLEQLNAAPGLTRPTADRRAFDVGGVTYPRCAVVTIVATDAPASA